MYPTIKEAEKSFQERTTKKAFQEDLSALFQTVTTFVSHQTSLNPDSNYEEKLSAQASFGRDWMFSGVWLEKQPQNTDAKVNIFLGLEKRGWIDKLVGTYPKILIILRVKQLPDNTYSKAHLLSENLIRIWKNNVYQGELSALKEEDFNYLSYLRRDINDLFHLPDT